MEENKTKNDNCRTSSQATDYSSMTITEIERLLTGEGFLQTSEQERLAVFSALQNDARPGVRRLAEKQRRAQEKLTEELARIEKMKEYEYRYADCAYIAGIDEVGRGPLAGPVVTCAVIMPKDCKIPYVNDSKKLTEAKRDALYEEICSAAISYGIGSASPKRIDEINILQATYEAMRQSIDNLKIKPQLLLNDAVTIPGVDIPQVPIIKGDAKCFAIAAASIIAKVTRDRLMEEYDKQYPGYGFAKNKGYGTAEHIDALKRLGPSPIHRKSFIQNFLEEEKDPDDGASK